MILVDTGPLIALFDPQDPWHGNCVQTLKRIREELITTVPVLTEAFHLIGTNTNGGRNLSLFINKGGLSLFFLNLERLTRALSLMNTYSDHPMDLADASLVLAGEYMQTNKIFTIDRRDFATYKIAKGYTWQSFELIY